MVKLEKVNKYFNRRKPNQIHIINNTSLELEKTGLVAILGHSGSGKTTILNAIGGLDKVNKGKIFVNGKKITKRSSYVVDKIRNLNIGYIFQDYKLLDNLSVYENVAISLKMIGIKNKKEIEKRVKYVLEAVKMYRYRNRPARMLSGGEKQRVAIARAIVKNPSIVIADEPTGNLDSKNSLEIMNIIKALSKDKLVILVTHEIDLANFYASRIIKLQDGKIIEDYENKPKESLEYRLDNKLYLKDFQSKDTLNKNKINVDLYTNNENNEVNIELAIKDGNIYIKSKSQKIEVIDENSAIELVNEHYKKLDKSIYDDYDYNLEKIIDKRYKTKYTSIYGIMKSIINGFKRISNYTILRKILLIGFFASSMFIVYSVSNIAGTLDIKDTDFMVVDKNYLQVDMGNVNVENFLRYEQLENIDYILPGDSNISFKIKFDDYYQLSRYSFELSGSLVSIDTINQNDIVKGRLPEDNYEIVVDKRVIEHMVNSDSGMMRNMGIKSEEELLNKTISMNNMKDFVIVGIADTKALSIFTSREMFINLLNNSTKSDGLMGMYIPTSNEETESAVMDYNLYLDDIVITKGRLPENDYEVIVNKSNQYDMKLNKKIKTKVNNNELKVVGYYDSKSNIQAYLVNNNTVKYDVVNKSNGLMIYPKNKQDIINKFKNEYNLNVIDRYERDKENYLSKKEKSIRSSIIFATIILSISLIEIYLMMRSSFLSRIKEIGIYRAIGVKKADIYRMFLGEILVITTFSSMLGIILMAYILNGISNIPYVDRMFIINNKTVGISILIVYLFNIIIGLMPLHRVLKKTPAQILSRYDLE
ncbi:ABC transporter ATP-binding protein/permease [Thomasclavelia cocleata]|uniref:ABC transporter ATP-binding protein/permease n=1 Tax=Thomasclavelia cocleata TaxID=69824 RepID=UPI00272E218D|nr:ABC transporter ATP-binding protein/permease [Thomasclavelia cocleata]